MPAFVPVPWLNSSDQFLHAMTSGAQVGLERARLRLEANRLANQGGGFNAQFIPPGAGALTPMEAANIELLKARTADELAQAEAHKNPYHVMSTGQGEVVRVNPLTGQSDIIFQPRDRTAPPLSPNDAATQGRQLLSIVGNPEMSQSARDAARANYKAIQKLYPQILSELPEEVKPPAAAVVTNESPPLFDFSNVIPAMTFGMFGGSKTNAPATTGRFKVETVP